jgi:HK97 family phage major capsid protein
VPEVPTVAEAERNRTQPVSPALVELLAKIVPEEAGKALGNELRQSVEKARREIRREEALAGAVADAVQFSATPRRPLAREQKAELFRLTIARTAAAMLGPQCTMSQEVNKELDEGGVITQAYDNNVRRAAQTQALTPTSIAAGAPLVPPDWQADIIAALLPPARIFPLIQSWPTNREHIIESGYLTEPQFNEGVNAISAATDYLEDLTETSPTFQEFDWYMCYCDALLPIKLDLLDDSPLGLYERLTARYAERLSLKRELQLLVGNGVAQKQPMGLLKTSINGISTVAINTSISTVAQFLAAAANLPYAYRYGNKARMLMSSTDLFNLVALLAVTVHSPEYFAENMDVLPVLMECPFIPSGTTLFGNFKAGYVAFVNTLMRMVSEVHAKRFTLDTAIVMKWDGKVVVPDAFRMMTGITYSPASGSSQDTVPPAAL